MQSFLVKAWYKKSIWLVLLLPFSIVFGWLAKRRRNKFESGDSAVWKSNIPVIVIGNITVGGTGKTPLVIYLATLLKEQGYKPGIVSRGYESKTAQFPQWVTPTTSVDKSGDEALVIARNTDCPVVIDPDRPRAIQTLLESNDCNIIISDDGLQHYAMGRDIEIAVLDGQRGLGNGWLLPAGPLREKPSRLREVDLVVVTGYKSNAVIGKARQYNNRVYPMELQSSELVSLGKTSNNESCALNAVTSGQTVHAVAGIGNPQRFFDSLIQAGFAIIPHVFPDHHDYSKEDLHFDDDLEIIMTEKDAVKCHNIAPDNAWYLKIEPILPDDFNNELLTRLSRITNAEH